MSLVAGVDSSTQSVKVLVCDAQTGEVHREASAPHPSGTEVDPEAWWQALEQACGGGLLDDVAAIAVAAQQHGMVCLDEDDRVVRPALLWNDTRSAPQATALVDELGGPRAWAEAVGSVPTSSFTVTKLRWLAENEPDRAGRVRQVLLPHDWLTHRLGANPAATDRGDASGTGYWSPASGSYRRDLAAAALGHEVDLPRVAEPSETVGSTPEGATLAAGTGDNMGAALAFGLSPGDVVVSLGTSGTVFAVSDHPPADPVGAVAGFADAEGRFLPLVCTLNAARVLDSTARLLGGDHELLSRLALDSSPGAGGLVLLPYFDGERTPDLPDATGTLAGLTTDSLTPANLARAAVEAVLCGLADGLDGLRAQGVRPTRLILIGGAARSEAVRTAATSVFDVPVHVPRPAEYVALGAARQAAWVLAGDPEPPDWHADVGEAHDPEPVSHVRDRYAELREALHP